MKRGVESILLLLGAVPARWPDGCYTLLRLIVCGNAVYLAFRASEGKRLGWAIVLGLTALLFNLILPVRMRRSDGVPFDIGAAVVLAVAAFQSGRSRGRQDLSPRGLQPKPCRSEAVWQACREVCPCTRSSHYSLALLWG